MRKSFIFTGSHGFGRAGFGVWTGAVVGRRLDALLTGMGADEA